MSTPSDYFGTTYGSGAGTSSAPANMVSTSSGASTSSGTSSSILNDILGSSGWNFGSTGSSSGLTYTVQSGDSLSAIAARYGTTLSALLAANPSITNPNVISVGQVINLPSGVTSSPAYVNPSPTYTAPVTATKPSTQLASSASGFSALLQKIVSPPIIYFVIGGGLLLLIMGGKKRRKR